MNRVRRTRVLQACGAGVLAAVLAFAYVATQGWPFAGASRGEKLSIALPALPHYSLVHIAIAKGYFSEEGLDAAIVPASQGVGAIGEVIRGTADLAIGGDVPFVISVMKGDDLAMVASLARITDDGAIVARRDRGIASARDLAGKKIGVRLGTSGSYFLWVFLIRNRVTPDSVALVDLPPDRIVRALAEGSIDALAALQPVSFEAQAALGSNAVTFTESDSYRTTIVAVGRRSFLNAHSGAMKKFARALLKAERYMQSRPEEALNLSAAWLKVDAEALRPTWKQFDFRVGLAQSQLAAMEDEARWAMSGGYAARGPVPNFLPHLYMDALLAVQPERVTVLR